MNPTLAALSVAGVLVLGMNSARVHAGSYEGTHVDAPPTANRVVGNRPGCEGKQIAGNAELKKSMTAAGAALTASGNPIAVAAGGVVVVLGKAWPDDPYQDFASCAVSCAVVPAGAKISAVELHFKGRGSGVSSDEMKGVGVADVPPEGMWDRGTGWWAAQRMTDIPTADTRKKLACVLFKNWSHDWDRYDVHEVVRTQDDAIHPRKPSRPTRHS